MSLAVVYFLKMNKIHYLVEKNTEQRKELTTIIIWACVAPERVCWWPLVALAGVGM
jgi:hypothetical protein